MCLLQTVLLTFATLFLLQLAYIFGLKINKIRDVLSYLVFLDMFRGVGN